LSNRQIFRSLRLYELTHYTLADLLAFEWYELYERSSKVVEEMTTAVMSSIAKNMTLPMVNVPAHTMKEFKVQPPQIYEVVFKNIAPVHQDTEVLGIIVNSTGRSLIDEISESKVEFI